MSFFSKLIAPAVLAAGLIGSSASAAILVTVDVSDPSAVTFTGTEVHAIASDSATVWDGFLLLDFLTGAAPAGTFVTNNLSNFVGAGSDLTFGDIFFVGGGGLDDVNIYNDPDFGQTLNIVAEQPAFYNTLVADLSALASLLPGAGTFGQIILGDNPTAQREAIGAYEVVGVAPVPLPAPALLLIGAIGAMAATRRRKSAPKTA